MNFSLHLTVLRGNNFDAYPLDSQADNLKKLSLGSKSSDVAAWAEYGIMNYYVMLNMPDGSTFGLLLGFKDLAVGKPLELLKIVAEYVFGAMPRRGDILRYSSKGHLEYSSPSLAMCSPAIVIVHSELTDLLTTKNRDITCKAMEIPALPPPQKLVLVAGSEPFDSINRLVVHDRAIVVISESHTYAADATYTVISGLRGEIERKETEINQQKETIRKLERSQKQYRFVVCLLLCLGIAGIGIYKLNHTLEVTEVSLSEANDSIAAFREELSAANDTITVRDSHIKLLTSRTIELNRRNSLLANAKRDDSLRMQNVIDSRDSEIAELNGDRSRLRSRIDKTENEILKAKQQLRQYTSAMGAYPFFIKNITHKGSTLYISYNAPTSRSATIKVSCYGNTGYLSGTTVTKSISQGNNTLTIASINSLSSATFILIESGGQIIGGTRMIKI